MKSTAILKVHDFGPWLKKKLKYYFTGFIKKRKKITNASMVASSSNIFSIRGQCKKLLGKMNYQSFDVFRGTSKRPDFKGCKYNLFFLEEKKIPRGIFFLT